ncbi:patatin-like phospholipase family protein [Rhodohalobacter mucosus]|uniref:Patatin n=1 Tax=Rhodohalobacter mucosus TaxID=2079485 RepID=A0A316TWB2_9BACT|nr:patatin-like phospholipase family protein [Rhodohalobacter mucosus]PWN08258.1 patatin [Rhodohalobacter mucosus]
MNKERFKETGIALGGGAALGAAHVGVMKAFQEHEIEPKYISGTSIGAFVAAHIAFGTSLEDLEEIALELDWLDVTSFKLSRLGLLNNEKLGKMILDQFGRVNIEESNIPLRMIATDISTGKKIVLEKGPLYKAVMASACLPGIFAPVEWEENLLVDGFLCENVPVTPLRKLGAEDIIGVDLTTNREFRRPDDIVDVLSNTFDIGLNNMIREQVKEERVFWIRPSLSAYSRADTGQTKKLIEEGYRAAMDALSAS